MQRLIIQIAIISCASVISKAYSQKTLIIEIIEKENHIEVIAKNDWHNQSFIIDDSDKLFSTCIDVDYIVSRRDKGNLEIINRLNSKINYLSQKLINPIMLLIDSSEIINIILFCARIVKNFFVLILGVPKFLFFVCPQKAQ
jgi:hypothetical protein